MESYEELWSLVKGNIREKIPKTSYDIWIKPLEFESFEDGTVILQTTNFIAGIVKTHFLDTIKKEFLETAGFDVKIEFDITDEKKIREKEKIDKINIPGDVKIDYTFDSFIVGPSNSFAYSAARSAAEKPGAAYNPLFIYGNSGLGKTHLLNAIKNKMIADDPSLNIVSVNTEDFINELITLINTKTPREKFREKYRNADALLVDDVQFAGGKDYAQEELYHTFDALTSNNHQIVFASDRPPREINNLMDRLQNRFEMGLLADIQAPDFETRCAIIKRKSDTLNFEMSDEVVNYLADNIKTNVRQLEGAVKKLYAYYRIDSHEPSVIEAKKAIKDVVNNDRPVQITIDKILDEVSSTYGVTTEDIISNKRDENIANARQAAMYIMKEKTGLSDQKIADRFNKHHSTVIYSVKKTRENMDSNTQIRNNIQNIMKNLDD